jgi:hypothetical protein
MLNLKLFSFRAPQRDRESDRARLAAVHKTVSAAVMNAEAELKGLRTRLERARRSAALFFTNLENGNLEAADRTQRKSVEGRLLAAERRVKQLTNHLTALQRIRSAVDEVSSSCQFPPDVSDENTAASLGETSAKVGSA